MSGDTEDLELDRYGDNEVSEYANTKIPKFLWLVYIVLPFWGVWWWMSFWNGSQGWLDRGYWSELSAAAKTKFVVEEDISKQKKPN